MKRAPGQPTLHRTAAFLRPHRRGVVLGVSLVLLYTAALLAGPAIVRYAIDEGLVPGEAAALWRAVAAYVVVALVGYGALRAQITVVTRVGEEFLRDLRVRVFDHLQSLPLGFYEGESAGTLISRMTADIDAVRQLVQGSLFSFVSNVLLLVLSFGVLLWMSPLLALLCFAAAPPVYLASRRFEKRSGRAWLALREGVGETMSATQEGLSGAREVRAFGREDAAVSRFRAKNTRQLHAFLAAIKINTRYFPIIEGVGVCVTAVVLVAGGLLVARDAVTLGTVVAFVLYLRNLFDPIEELSSIYGDIQQAGAALVKVFALLDTEPDLTESRNPRDLPERGTLAAENVSFAYASGSPVLRDASLAVRPGETLALVGATGAGKSTLNKLLARFYDPDTGRVTFGGIDLRDARLDVLRRRIVSVSQEGFLFNASIRENVRIGDPGATDEEVEQALRDLGVYGRFAKLPDGLDTSVAARGGRLSAGERQLVSLGRAALADPAVLILDEATSSLDPGTEALAGDALERLTHGRATVVIAHRLTTAARADRVAVMEGGRLVEEGTHEELLKRGGSYAQMWAAWQGERGEAVGIAEEKMHQSEQRRKA